MNKDSDAKQMYYAQKGFGPTTHDNDDDDSGDENEKEEGEISEDEPKPKWDNNIIARTFIKKFIDEVKKTSTGNRKEVDEYDNAISYFYHEGEDYLKQAKERCPDGKDEDFEFTLECAYRLFGVDEGEKDEEIAKRFEFLMENAEEMYPNGRAAGPWMALCQEAVEFLAEERDSFALLTIAEKYADDDNDDEDDEEGEDKKNADDEMSENEETVDDDDDHKTETLSDDEQILTPTTDASETATSLTVEQVERIRACQIVDKKHAEVKRNTTYTWERHGRNVTWIMEKHMRAKVETCPANEIGTTVLSTLEAFDNIISKIVNDIIPHIDFIQLRAWISSWDGVKGWGGCRENKVMKYEISAARSIFKNNIKDFVEKEDLKPWVAPKTYGEYSKEGPWEGKKMTLLSKSWNATQKTHTEENRCNRRISDLEDSTSQIPDTDMPSPQ